MITDGVSKGSGSGGSASDSAIGGNGDVTNASTVTGTIIDSGVIPIIVAGNSAVAGLFGGFQSNL
jgi:hypothetical protein